MGNRSVFVIMFSLIMVSLQVFAAGTNSTPAKTACDSVGTPKDITEAMRYVGRKFSSSTAKCVNADNDQKAIDLCRKAGGNRILNPGNPQYGFNQQSAAGQNEFRNKNNFGFYLCYNNENDKRKMCQELESNPKLSSYNDDRNPGDKDFVTFKWKAVGNDGDCECSLAKSDSSVARMFHECSKKPPEAPEEAPKQNPATCESKGGEIVASETGDMCRCKNGDFLGSVADATCPTGETKASPPDLSGQLKACLDQHAEKVKSCAAQSKAAADKCSKDYNEKKKEQQDKSAIVKMISDAFVRTKAGSGSMAECAGASMLASGAIQLLNENLGGCESDLKFSIDVCKEADQSFNEACKQFATTAGTGQPKTKDDELIAQYETQNAEVRKSGVTQVAQAKQNSDMLKQVLSGMEQSQKSAAQCACQLSAQGAPPGQTCTTLPSAAECATVTPPPQGCPINGGAFTMSCQPGAADFNSPACQCLRNPSMSSCPQPGTTPPPNFLGADIKPSGFAGSPELAGGGGMASGDSDFDIGGLGGGGGGGSGKTDPQGGVPSMTNGGGGGGGGASGGGMASGGEGGDGKEHGEEAEKKDGGLMNQLKNAVNGLFKGSPAAGKDSKNGLRPNTKPDPDKWRPRGVAGAGCKGSQVRCKNETLWDIMNGAYDRDRVLNKTK